VCIAKGHCYKKLNLNGVSFEFECASSSLDIVLPIIIGVVLIGAVAVGLIIKKKSKTKKKEKKKTHNRVATEMAETEHSVNIDN
jgi:ligand-binding sensor protein